jgi:adenine-specific DNA methylase
MSKKSQESDKDSERKELPIERGYPIEQVNEIVDRENQAKRYYRPLYTIHKWWARRLGSVFRTIALYSLLDDPTDIEVHRPGQKGDLDDFLDADSEIDELISQVDLENSDSLWKLYNKDVRVSDKKVLDPFMGGGTSLIEASRLGAEVVGNDLNPVAWFVSKKELEAGKSDVEELDEAFSQVQNSVEDELTTHYETECPDCHDTADVMYYLWVNELDCVSCKKTVSLFKDYRVAKGRYDNKGKYNVLCPACESIILVDDWRSECSCGDCGNSFTPEDGTVSGGDYA